MHELLKTKLFIPRPRSNLVSRPRLTQRLDRRLTLVAAPAGFGKTTLLSEWIPQSPRCVTWLSLDDGDNDPARFWAYLIASVQQIHPELGQSALARLQSPQAPSIRAIITSLINDIVTFPDSFCTVLDDYHFIDTQPIHEGLAYLIDHLPANYHLVITTRVNPPLSLARLQARDQLSELRANDLRFTGNETAVFLTQATGLSLSANEISALGMRIEGWIAGLQIAALSMQGHDDIPGFIREFSGSHRHILGYLADEVLDQRPEGTLNFLLQTSILDRMCGSLCDAVTGNTGGQVMLEKLDRAQLFLSPLDDRGIWYRYHHLFAEVLRARLQRIWPDRVHELHHRAGNWYAQQGMMEEAIRHALAGSDVEGAARLIEAVAGSMLRQGASASLALWLDAMPEETVRSRPRLCLTRGWIYFMGSKLDLKRSEQWAQRALQVAQVKGSQDASLTGEVAALRAMIAATRGELALSLELSRQALFELPPDSSWRGAVAFSLGTAHYLSGDLAAASRVFEQAIDLSQVGKEKFIQTASASFLAEILLFQGQLSRAMNMFEQVLAWVNPSLPQKGGIMAYGGRAAILYERDQLDAALAQAQSGIEQVDQVGGAWSAYVLYRVQARVQHARGNWVDALETLDRAYRIAQTAEVDLVAFQVAALRAHLQLTQGNLEAAANWAALSGLSLDDEQASHPGWHEREYLTLARVLTAQVRHTEALFLLDRLQQAAEVEGRVGSVIEILAQQSMVFQQQGNPTRALASLERAMKMAEPEGYVRTFVDECEPMRQLLLEYKSIYESKPVNQIDQESHRLLAYADRLLFAFPQSIPVGRTESESGLDPLTERELEVLQLIEEGLSNQEIAEEMVVAVSTVKSHINSLYSKLGTHRRTQAINIAKDQGLLSD
jgi:LuxR family maltose regulon positive regulatory protein